MRFRTLRIAFSATCLIACVLLVALWVRSYWQYDWLGGLLATPPKSGEMHFTNGCLFESANGVVTVLHAGKLWGSLSYLRSVGTSSADPKMRVTGNYGESVWSGFRADVGPNGYFRGSLPIWFLALTTMAASALPWFRWRFSLRTLLIAMTLVTVALGLIIYLAKSAAPPPRDVDDFPSTYLVKITPAITNEIPKAANRVVGRVRYRASDHVWTIKELIERAAEQD